MTSATSNAANVLIPLSPMDAVLIHYGFAVIYVFPAPAEGSERLDVHKLQNAFQSVVNENYTVFIGAIQVDSDSGRVSVLQTPKARQHGARGLRFEVQQTNSLTSDEVVQSLAWSFMPSKLEKQETIAVRCTPLLDGGVAVGITLNHTLMDGEGLFTFMKAWGQHYSGVEKANRLMINHDRHLLSGTEVGSQRQHPEVHIVPPPTGETIPISQLPATTQHAFHVSKANMQAQGISRICSEGFRGRPTVCHKSELQPETGKDFASINDEMLIKLARRVRSSILNLDSDFLRDAIEFVAEQDHLSRAMVNTKYILGPDLMFTSWANMGLYDADFAGIRPCYAGIAKFPFLDGMVVITEAAKGADGLDVLVFLECVAMDKLKELCARVSYLQDERALELGFNLLCSIVSAASDTCTVFQIHTTIEGIAGVISAKECGDYATNSSLLSVPCDASSCISAVEDLVSTLPDCTLLVSDNGGTSANKKEELQSELKECSADSTGSVRVEAVDTTSTSATSISSNAGDQCTNAEASTTARLYLGAAGSSACEQYTMTDEASMTVIIYAPCSATQCVSVMETMVQQLPDCYTDGVNMKDEVTKSLASCTSGGSSSLAMVSSSSSNECSHSELASLAYLTNSIVTSAECTPYVTATTTEWYIQVPCSASMCLSTLSNAVQQMPDCEFEGINYKDELGIQQEACVGITNSSGASGSGDSTNLRTEAPAGSTTSTDTSASAGSRLATIVGIEFLMFILVTAATS
ncbi:unnamed protein product [Phytophthora lilii]|uniref:Unnamed protein product n=1 Tax=Phytophthora lilii TaxID=2077276 RepID=A0A9W6WUA7_9STRA|nr:unnamed protein product [Phytophthora lilii]